MAYTPTTWKTGDTITAEKLNHAEQGIADALECLVINISVGEGDVLVSDVSYNEIDTAFQSGITCIVHASGKAGFLSYGGTHDNVRWYQAVMFNMAGDAEAPVLNVESIEIDDTTISWVGGMAELTPVD